MARNGSGTYERAVADYVYNTTIDQNTVNQEMDDIASALTGSLAKNGETVPTANLPMGTYRHTGVGNGSARTDYAALGQVQDGKANWVDGGGTADAITATYSPVITALVDGQLCYVRATAANATTTPTFSPNGLTARTIVKNGGVALAAGDIVGDGHELELRYDLTNTRWELLNPKTDLSGYQPLDTQLTTLAGITAQQATDLAAVSTFMGTVLNDADAATARATLGLPALLNQNYGSDGATKITTNTTAGVDFNTHTSAGVYNFDATSSANAPVTGLVWIFLEVFRHFDLAAGSEYTVQIAHDMNAGTRPRSWTRRQVAGSWSAWQLTTPVAPGDAPIYACRAWVNFAGATGAIRASGNVASVTRNGVGDYTINFTTALEDANYSVCGVGADATFVSIRSSTAPTASAVRLDVRGHDGVSYDYSYVNVAIFR